MTGGDGFRGARGAMWVLIGTLCMVTFLANGSATALAPFLIDIAHDLGVDLAAAGLLVSIGSVSWAVTSLVAGAASDRLGRKPILMFGAIVLACSPLGMGLAPDYGFAALARLIGGVGGGAFIGTVFATASDNTPEDRRGQALGWIVTGQSLALVLGAPAITMLGAAFGWRGALIAQSLAMFVGAVAVWLVVPNGNRTRTFQHGERSAMSTILNGRVVALLVATTAERLCYASVVVYLATYLLTTYAIPLDTLAVCLFLVALGNLVGNVAGGYLANRPPARLPVAALSLATTGLIALPLLLWHPGIQWSVALGLLYTFVNSLARPALLAAVSDLSVEARGAILGLNTTFASFGWLGASAIGGLLITTAGFGALGVLGCVVAMVGAALCIVSRSPRPQPAADLVQA